MRLFPTLAAAALAISPGAALPAGDGAPGPKPAVAAPARGQATNARPAAKKRAPGWCEEDCGTPVPRTDKLSQPAKARSTGR